MVAPVIPAPGSLVLVPVMHAGTSRAVIQTTAGKHVLANTGFRLTDRHVLCVEALLLSRFDGLLQVQFADGSTGCVEVVYPAGDSPRAA